MDIKPETIKNIQTALLVFGVAVCANIVGSTIYAKSKIGVDTKKMLLGVTAGVGLTFLVVKMLKK